VDQVLFYGNDQHGYPKLVPILVLEQCVKELIIKGTHGVNWIVTAAVKFAIHPKREGPKEANVKRCRNCLSMPPTTRKAPDRQATGQCVTVSSVISQFVTIRTVGHGIYLIHSRIAMSWLLVLSLFPVWVSCLLNKV
jgi:hypothetical protein